MIRLLIFAALVAAACAEPPVQVKPAGSTLLDAGTPSPTSLRVREARSNLDEKPGS